MNPILEAYLDLEQGTDPELLEARSRMPEPVANPGPFFRIMLPHEPSGFWDPNCDVSAWYCRSTVLFERDEVLAPGCSFWVWRAERDGKIYL